MSATRSQFTEPQSLRSTDNAKKIDKGQKLPGKRAQLALLLVLPLAMLGGCAQLGYYAQAMQGQMSLLASAKPIDTWLADPGIKDTLKARLRLAQEIRAFAASELGLPDNGS